MLQKELDKYGIRNLKRHQAKLILRHIYNELHPIVPATPIASTDSSKLPHHSPVSSKSRGGMRAPRARGRRGGISAISRNVRHNPHNMSLSQPELAQDNEDFEETGQTSGLKNCMSQPACLQDEDDDKGSSDSSESSDEDR